MKAVSTNLKAMSIINEIINNSQKEFIRSQLLNVISIRNLNKQLEETQAVINN